jgi:hypothetical protein
MGLRLNLLLEGEDFDQYPCQVTPALPRAAHPASAFSETQNESPTAWIRLASEMVSDLHRRSALLYWTDFLLSAGTFIHEIIHFRKGELAWFARAWNAGMGIPLLTAASAGVINPYYRRRFPKSGERHLLIVEILCCAWLVLLGVLLVMGVITWLHTSMETTANA